MLILQGSILLKACKVYMEKAPNNAVPYKSWYGELVRISNVLFLLLVFEVKVWFAGVSGGTPIKHGIEWIKVLYCCKEKQN